MLPVLVRLRLLFIWVIFSYIFWSPNWHICLEYMSMTIIISLNANTKKLATYFALERQIIIRRVAV